MILHHVAQRTRAFIVTGAAFDTERFRRGDLQMIDVTPVPKRRENGVGEPENENVLRSFFAEKMIDAIGLFLSKALPHYAIELACRSQIRPERLFNYDSGPAVLLRLVQAGGLEIFQDRFELIWSDGKIEKAVAARSAFLVDLIQALGQTFVSGLVLEFALMIKNRLRERVPDFVAHALARELSCRLFHFLSELVVAFLATGETDHRNSGREFSIGSEVVKRRHKFAMSEIARGAKNYYAAWLRYGPR